MNSLPNNKHIDEALVIAIISLADLHHHCRQQQWQQQPQKSNENRKTHKTKPHVNAIRGNHHQDLSIVYSNFFCTNLADKKENYSMIFIFIRLIDVYMITSRSPVKCSTCPYDVNKTQKKNRTSGYPLAAFSFAPGHGFFRLLLYFFLLVTDFVSGLFLPRNCVPLWPGIHQGIYFNIWNFHFRISYLFGWLVFILMILGGQIVHQ